MTSNPMITKDFLRTIHLYCYEDVQEFLSIHRMLEEELEKPTEEMDMVLVEECLDYIDVVMSQDSAPDEETLDAKYQEVLAKASQSQAAEQPKAKVIRSKKRSVRKFFFILAATITVLFTTLTIAAKVNGYKNAWEFVYQKAIEIMGLDTGEIIEEENITMIHNGEVEAFASFEDFLEKENLDILYPQPLPDNFRIETIRKYCFDGDRLAYTVMFNSPDTSLIVKNYPSVIRDNLEYIETFEVCQNIFYITITDNYNYQAICQTGKFEYTIIASDYPALITLLQNMKGS